MKYLPKRRKLVGREKRVRRSSYRGPLQLVISSQAGSSTKLTSCAFGSYTDGNQELLPCEVCGRRFAADVLVNIKTFCRCVSLELNELSSQ